MDVFQASVIKYFSDEANFMALKALLANKHTQPRLIDYYVTQYCKNNPEFFVNTESVSDVYNSYKLQLKGYHKKHFNLFCKKNIVSLKCESSTLLLPLAKVNVYKWLISNKITNLLDEKHHLVQRKYYDFRKVSIDKTRKRGKMDTFLKIPTLIRGVSVAKKKM